MVRESHPPNMRFNYILEEKGDLSLVKNILVKGASSAEALRQDPVESQTRTLACLTWPVWL